MYQKCLKPSVIAPRRTAPCLRYAERSSGGLTLYAERPGGSRAGTWASREEGRRVERGRDKDERRRDEWRDDRRRDERRDDRRWDERRDDRRRDERRDDRRWDERRGDERRDERRWDERRDERRGDERRDDPQQSQSRDDGRTSDSPYKAAGQGSPSGSDGYGGRAKGDTGYTRQRRDPGGRTGVRPWGQEGGDGGDRRRQADRGERGDINSSSSTTTTTSSAGRQYTQTPRAAWSRESDKGDDDNDDHKGDDVGDMEGLEDEEADGPMGRRGPAGPCLRDTLQGEALYGVFPVLAALRAKRRKVHRAFLLASMDLSKRKDAGLVRQVEALCTEAGVEVVRTSRHELNLMSHDRPHQGLVLDVSPLEWAPLDEFPSAEEVVGAGAAEGRALPPPVWLALDEVVDPQNLGAVVRSAFCLGAAGVLVCSRNCAPLSAVVSKASAGALEALQLHTCHNLPRTLQDARDLKGWVVLGAAAGSGSEPVGRVRVDRPTILVLGSEGFGLRTNTRRACSRLVRVEMAPYAGKPSRGGSSSSSSPASAAWPATDDINGRGSSSSRGSGDHLTGGLLLAQRQQQQQILRGLVDSLNVSVATGILLHSLINSAAASTAAAAAPSGDVDMDVVVNVDMDLEVRGSHGVEMKVEGLGPARAEDLEAGVC